VLFIQKFGQMVIRKTLRDKCVIYPKKITVILSPCNY